MQDKTSDGRQQKTPSRLRVFVPAPAKHGAARLQRLARPRGVGYAVTEFSRACLIRLIDYPELPFRTSAHETVKIGGSALIVRTRMEVGGKPRAVAYKRVRRQGLLKRLTALVRTSRALRSFQTGHRLLACGIPTATPLAVILPGGLSGRRESFAVTEWIEGSLDLVTFCRRLQWEPESVRARSLRATAVSLGRLLGRLHGAKISHRDLKGGNLLVRADGRGVETFVIDLDGAAVRWRLSQRERAKNLARLMAAVAEFDWMGHTSRLRFLKTYLIESGRAADDWKPAWKRLERYGRHVIERKRRSAQKRAA